MKIKKVLNNNVVIAQNDNEETILMGLGLGFGKKAGEVVEMCIRDRNKSADSNKITFTHQEQNKFLKNTKENTYDFVFSAMNPALESKEALVELNRIANGNVGILRLIFDEDNLFSQVEQLYLPNQEQNKEAQMLLYKVWLEELGWEFKSKKFRFFLSEKVSSQFFSDYFSDELSNAELAALTQLFFSETEIREMERLVIFELLYWEKC